MGFFDFFKKDREQNKENENKESLNFRKLSPSSDNREYLREANNHIRVHNQLELAKDELSNKKDNIQQINDIKGIERNEIDKYATDKNEQIISQNIVKSFLFRMLSHRYILADTINKINTKWPEKQNEITDMIIDSEQEIKADPKIKDVYKEISAGKDPDFYLDETRRSRKYDIGREERLEDYQDLLSNTYLPTKRQKQKQKNN